MPNNPKTVENLEICTVEHLARILHMQLDSLSGMRKMASPNTDQTAEQNSCSSKLPRSCVALKVNGTLTKLVLQRIADDYLLEVVGKTLDTLKHLDVSGSIDVTNKGLCLLLIKSARENSSLCHMSSWGHKNLHLMNPIVHSLEYLDFSYTKANFSSRRLVALLPAALAYQRIFRLDESDCLGHYVFHRGRVRICL